jgi:hypothetical protein
MPARFNQWSKRPQRASMALSRRALQRGWHHCPPPGGCCAPQSREGRHHCGFTLTVSTRPCSMAQNLGGESFQECPYSEASHIGKGSCSARAFDLVTQVLASSAQSGGPFFGIRASNHGHLMISPRGIPLKRNGHVVEALRSVAVWRTRSGRGGSRGKTAGWIEANDDVVPP